MRNSFRLVEQGYLAALIAAAFLLSPSIADARSGNGQGFERRPDLQYGLPGSSGGAYLRPSPSAASREHLGPDGPGRQPARFQKFAEQRPSAAAIQRARQNQGLPPSARAVGWRLVESSRGRVWKVIFRVGNRQVAVEVPAGR